MENHDATAWPLKREAHFLRCCREAREGQGMSQRELSRRLQEHGITLHQSSIAKLEREGEDRRPLRMAEAIALSIVLRVPLWDAFLDLEDPDLWRTSALERRRSELERNLLSTLTEIQNLELVVFTEAARDRLLVQPLWSQGHGEPSVADRVMQSRGIEDEDLPSGDPRAAEASRAAKAYWEAITKLIDTGEEVEGGKQERREEA